MKPASSAISRERAALRKPDRRARGFTLLDVLVLITLLAIVAASVVALFTNMASQSAQLMRNRQAVAVAQSLLDEVRMMPFTTCDRNAAGCGPTVEAMGPEVAAGETTRYHTAASNFNSRYDNVNDYNNLSQPGPGCLGGLCNIQGTLLNPAGSTLEGCTSDTTVTQQALAAIPATEGLLITVTVNCPGLTSPVVLQGIRTRHAPNNY